MNATAQEIEAYVRSRADQGNGFYRSLNEKIERWGELSPNQTACVLKDMFPPVAAARAPAASFQLDTIFAMFNRAKAAGLKRPAYRAAGLVLSRASDTSANPGCIYVKRISDDAYLGKIAPTGEFRKVREAGPQDMEALADIEAAPAEAAVKWGKMTGQCSCCGRPLSDPKSVEMGIGPICAAKWGF